MDRYPQTKQFSSTAHTQIADLGLEHLGSGKVRELYAWGDDHLVFVATDRLSAFDVVMRQGIPGKGEILTQMSRFWFEHLEGLVSSQIVPEAELPEDWLEFLEQHPELKLRTMFVQKVKPLEFEFVVRGYLSGSGWKSYKSSQTVCGVHLPAGLIESARLLEPILTPTTKPAVGHDEPVDHATCRDALGADDFRYLHDTSISIFQRASEFAAKQGIILADTKFEFGRRADGSLVLIDEIFTPDSARYWPANTYSPGGAQQSYDKQFVRDWLETQDWNKNPPAPDLPDSVIEGTRERYLEAYESLVLSTTV